jgi:hypothetical protein
MPEGLSEAHAAVAEHAELASNHNEVPQGLNEGGIEEVLLEESVKHNELPEGVDSLQSEEKEEEEVENVQLAAELIQVKESEEKGVKEQQQTIELQQQQQQQQQNLVPESTVAATPKHLLHVANEVAAGTMSDPHVQGSGDDKSDVYPSPQATGKSDDEVDTTFSEESLMQRQEPLRVGVDVPSQEQVQAHLDQMVLPGPLIPKIAESPTDSVSFNRYLRMARYTLDTEVPPLFYSYRFLFLTCVAVVAFFFYFAYGIQSAHKQIARSKKY